MFSSHCFETSSHTSLSDHCKDIKFAEKYVYRNFGLKTLGG